MTRTAPQQQRKNKILIVDDSIANIDVLTAFLSPLYSLMIAMNGSEALQCCLKKKQPDLILLDVMMPGMNGYEVCQQLQAHDDTRDIPIIFVTAANSVGEEIKGFQAGAVDFIAKPVNELTLRARIATHLELSRLRKESLARSRELENLVHERTKKLRSANARLQKEIENHGETARILRDNEIKAMRASHLTALGTIAAGMAHEINNPNSFIKLNIPILDEIFTGLINHCAVNNSAIRVGSLSRDKIQDMVPKLLHGIGEGSRRIEYIINHLDNFSRQDQHGQMPETEINSVIEDALMMLTNEIKRRSVTVQKNLGRTPLIPINRYQIEQALMNILQNAMDSFRDGHRTIWIASYLDTRLENVCVEIKDNGCGMTPEIADRIFEPFFTTKMGSGGTGLGLPTSYRIISEHGGNIDVASTINCGTSFTLTLPLPANTEEQ